MLQAFAETPEDLELLARHIKKVHAFPMDSDVVVMPPSEPRKRLRTRFAYHRDDGTKVIYRTEARTPRRIECGAQPLTDGARKVINRFIRLGSYRYVS